MVSSVVLPCAVNNILSVILHTVKTHFILTMYIHEQQQIMTANKKQMEIVGNINLDIQLGSAPIRGNKCELVNIQFLIIKELSAECLIGQDILLEWFDGLDFVTKRLLYGARWSQQYWIHLELHSI